MPRNENPLEKQLLHLDLSKGCDEVSRPETADPTSTLTRLDNLTQDQNGAYIKRPGTPFLGGTPNDDQGNPLLVSKLIRTRDSLAAIGSTGKFYQYQEAIGTFRQRGQIPDFTVTSDLVVGSGPVVSPNVYSSSTSSKFHAMVHAAGVDTGAGNPSIFLTVYDRNSGSIVAQYDVGRITGALALQSAMAVFVDDRYIHTYVGTSSTTVAFVIDTQASLPANEAAISPVTVSGPRPGIIDVVSGVGRSYAMYFTPTGATNVSTVTNALAVTGVNVSPNTAPGLQIAFSGTKLWFMTTTNLGALDPVTLAVSIASAAHGGPSSGYIAADTSDVVWLANETVTAVGSTNVTTVQFRKTTGTNSTTYAAVTTNLDAWKIAGTPFVIGSSKVYVHLIKDSTFTVSPHAVVPMDPAIMSTVTWKGVSYNSVRIAAAPENHIGVSNASVLRILAEGGLSGTKAGLMIAIQTSARASGYCVYELSVVGQPNVYSQNFGGQTYISGGCQVIADGGDQPVEVGFVDIPRVDSTATATAGNPNGAYKYLAVYRYISSSGSVAWSRVSPIASATVASKQITVSVTAPSVTIHDKELGAVLVSANVSVEVYRTSSGGTNYYLVGSSQTGTPAAGLATQIVSLAGGTRQYVFTDNIADTVLISQPLLFRQPGTSNAALDRYPPPAGTVLCQHKDRLFTTDPNGIRVYYSSFFVDGETAWFNPLFSFLVHGGSGPITSIISMDGRLFVFKRDGIFVVDGDGPAEGGVSGNEFSPPQRLATEYGCIDQRSVCVTTDGVVYRSARGIEILTRALQVKWLGDRVFNTVNNNPKTCGALLDTFGQVHVAMAASDSGTNLSTVQGVEAVYDFTTDSWNVYTHTSSTGVVGAAVQDILMANLNGKETLCIADPYGGVCSADRTTGLDRGSFYVGWTLETAWIRTGQQARQRITKALLLAKKRVGSNHKITISAAYNYLDGYGEAVVFEPDTINDGTIEELEKLLTSPQTLAVRLLIQEAAPTDLVTYPVGLGQGCDLLGVTFQVAPKDGVPMVSSARRGNPVVVSPASPITTEAGDGIVMESGDPITMES